MCASLGALAVARPSSPPGAPPHTRVFSSLRPSNQPNSASYAHGCTRHGRAASSPGPPASDQPLIRRTPPPQVTLRALAAAPASGCIALGSTVITTAFAACTCVRLAGRLARILTRQRASRATCCLLASSARGLLARASSCPQPHVCGSCERASNLPCRHRSSPWWSG